MRYLNIESGLHRKIYRIFLNNISLPSSGIKYEFNIKLKKSSDSYAESRNFVEYIYFQIRFRFCWIIFNLKMEN